MRRTVQHNEILPSEHERLLLESTWHRKRIRQPTVSIVSNPCCTTRQLTDEYELMRLNRNPQLYAVTKADVQRSQRLNTQHDDYLQRTDVNAVKKKVLRKAKLQEEVLAMELAAAAGDLPDAGDLDARIDPANIPHFDVYNKELTAHMKGPSYGHRPRSAGRIFNPLAQTLTQAPPGGNAHKTVPGMSVAQLRGLLTAEAPEPRTGTQAYQTFAGDRRRQRADSSQQSGTGGSGNGNGGGGSSGIQGRLTAADMDSLAEEAFLPIRVPKKEWRDTSAQESSLGQTNTSAWDRTEALQLSFQV